MPASEQVAEHVLTGENFAEFAFKRLGLSDPPAEPEAVVNDEAEKPAEPEEPDEGVGKKRELSVRMSELANKRKEAEAKAAEAERRAEDAERRLKALEEANKPKTSDARPDPSQYADISKYAEELEKWSRAQAYIEYERTQAEKSAKAAEEELNRRWNRQLIDTRKDIPDFDEVMEKANELQVSPEVTQAIKESDIGGRLVYHLAQHPDLTRSLATTSVAGALRELGRVEGRLLAQKEAPAQKLAPRIERERKEAPEPITPVRGGADIGGIDPDHMSAAQWKAARRAGKIK